MLLGATARTGEQASSLGVFLGLALGALGGCMIPLQLMPATMQSIARLIPQSWALTGLQSLIADGGGIASVAPNLAVLRGFRGRAHGPRQLAFAPGHRRVARRPLRRTLALDKPAPPRICFTSH